MRARKEGGTLGWSGTSDPNPTETRMGESEEAREVWERTGGREGERGGGGSLLDGEGDGEQ